MNNLDQFDSGKPNKRAIKKNQKKISFDEDQRDQFKLNKSFKQRRKELLEEDTDWEQWEEDYQK
jgi:hypothetical protein